MPRYVALLRGVSPLNAKMPELNAYLGDGQEIRSCVNFEDSRQQFIAILRQADVGKSKPSKKAKS